MTKLYEYMTNDTRATFICANGTNIELDIANMTPEIRQALMFHGLKQKVADAAAIPRDTVTGRSASDSDKIAAMMAVADRLRNGEWRAVGEGAPTGGMLLAALMELYPTKTREALVEYLARKTPAEKAALRASSKVAPIIERIRVARGANTEDTAEAMLNELEDDGE